MKKLLMITVMLGGVAAMTSCKKDWTCECTATAGGNSVTTSTTLENLKKKDAEASCNYTLTVGTSSTTCAIVE